MTLISVPKDFFKLPPEEQEYQKGRRRLQRLGEWSDTMPKTLRGISRKRIQNYMWFLRFELSFFQAQN